MKHFMFILLVGTFLLTSCKQNSNPQTDQAGNYTSGKSSDRKEAKIVPASVLAPIIGTWEVQVTLGMAKAERRKAYEGRWFALRGDQSFATGIADSETNQGVYEFDGDSFLLDLFFDNPEPGVAEQYKLLGVGGADPNILIWQGNTPKNPAGMQLKMIRIDDPNLQ